MRLLALLLFMLVPSPQQLAPRQSNDEPFWKGCEDMIPAPKSDDGSFYHICTDVKDHKWEVVDRTISRHCEETITADQAKWADYQHFTCVDSSDLFIRPVKAKVK